jgi:hypothetical protein
MVVLGEKNFQQQEGLPRVQEIAHASTESSDRCCHAISDPGVAFRD